MGLSVYEILFKNANEAILLVNQKGIICLANPSIEKLFGYEEGELIDQDLKVLLPKKYKPNHDQLVKSYVSNPTNRTIGKSRILYGIKKNGEEIPVDISLSPYIKDEETFTLAFVLDITNRLNAERELEKYNKNLENTVAERTAKYKDAIVDLQEAKKDLNSSLVRERRLNELKSRFVSVVSHEFRTPLATISSSLSLIKSYALKEQTDKQFQHIAKIKNSISQLLEMIDDVLKVNIIEEGKVNLEIEEIIIKEFLSSIVADFELVSSNNNTFKIECAVGASLEMKTDKKMLFHIFQNLLSNAVKFSLKGSEICIKVEKQKEDIIFKIENIGQGIPKKDQEHIFERFFRAQNSSTIPGTGLGLSISKQYATLLFGRLYFESIEGKKTAFYLVLPQKIAFA